MAIGYLTVQVRTAGGAVPLSGARIQITDSQGQSIYDLTTDESGETRAVSLGTTEKSLSLTPCYPGIPYMAYNILAQAAGFNSVYISDIPIYDAETAIQPISLIPMQQEQRSPFVTEITVGSPAVAAQTRRYQRGSTEEPRVLRQAAIPNPITVHLGSPTSSASNVQVSFSDYVKNVASSEIYPTWPEAALRANIYAIITFALNRVFTEW